MINPTANFYKSLFSVKVDILKNPETLVLKSALSEKGRRVNSILSRSTLEKYGFLKRGYIRTGIEKK